MQKLERYWEQKTPEQATTKETEKLMREKLCEGHFLCWQVKYGAQSFLSACSQLRNGWLNTRLKKICPLKKCSTFCVANNTILAQEFALEQEHVKEL